MRNVVVLGSTGSVGKTALDVIGAHSDSFRVAGLAARSSAKEIARQAIEHRAPRVSLRDDDARARLGDLLAGRDVAVVDGNGGLAEMIEAEDVDVVLNAIVGVAGLEPALRALRAGKTLAVANKEPFVAAGPLLLAAARESGAAILPVDSEHSAIFQSLRAGRSSEIRQILLTGSGGPFRTRPLDTFPDIRVEEALRHPTWSMGPKITIDSATMMNKALEIVEAVALFDVPADRIRVLIHPQSIVHSMVEFRDGSVVGQMGRPDMRLPVQYALSYPERLPCEELRFRIEDYRNLTFEDPDPERYPALELGWRAAREGGLAGAVLNAANECAVEAFLAGRIPFPEITRLAAHALDTHERNAEPDLAAVREADRRARLEVERCLSS